MIDGVLLDGAGEFANLRHVIPEGLFQSIPARLILEGRGLPDRPLENLVLQEHLCTRTDVIPATGKENRLSIDTGGDLRLIHWSTSPSP